MIPDVSVVIPVYNVERCLPRLLDSLKAQTLKKIEFILVNDGSTDRSGEILRESLNGDSRFQIIEQENQGAIAARNRALELAKGKYIGFADSDDWTDPELYERLFCAAEKNDADLVQCSFSFFFEKSETFLDYDNSPQIALLEESKGSLSGAEELFLDSGMVWNKLFRHTMIREHNIRFEPGMYLGEDCFFYWSALCHARKIAAIPYKGYFYRQQRSGAQTSASGRSVFGALLAVRKFYEFLQLEQRDDLKKWCNHLCLSYLCFAYAKLKPEYKDEFFNEFRIILSDNSFFDSSQIAVSQARGGLFHSLRYVVLKRLHPMTLNALHSGNRKKFDRIIALRETLVTVQSMLARKIKNICGKTKN